MQNRSPAVLSPALRRAAAEVIARTLGLAFPGAQESFRDAGIVRATIALGEESPDRTIARAASGDGAAIAALACALTVSESYFFRDPEHFALLRDRVLAPRAGGHGPVRLWSAGCAGGEEAYSLAITALEALGEAQASRIEVIATDVNEELLVRARAGSYRAWSLRGVGAAVREKWFARDDERWTIAPRVQRLVRFARLNLVGGPEAAREAETIVGTVDAIFCRNVLIYFDEPAVASAAARLASALGPEGWVFPGPADPAYPAGVALRSEFIDGVRTYRAGHGPALPAFDDAVRARPPRAPSSPPAPPAPPGAAPPAPFERAPPSGLEADEARARDLADAGNVDDALALVDAILARDPFRAPAYVLRAALGLDRRTYAAATLDAARASLLDRTLAMPHVLAAAAWRALGDGPSATRALRLAVGLLRADESAPVPYSGGLSHRDLLDLCRRLGADSAERAR